MRLEISIEESVEEITEARSRYRIRRKLRLEPQKIIRTRLTEKEEVEKVIVKV